MCNRTIRIGLGALVLTMGVFAASGCKHSQPGAQTNAMFGSSADNPKLTPSQIADVQYSMARSLEMRGDIKQAMAAYHEVLKHDPRRADAHVRLATIHAKLSHFDEAIVSFQKALSMKPGDADLFCDMGYCLFLQGRLEEARMNLRQALALEPDHDRAHNNLGLVFAYCGSRAEALAEFHRAGCEDADACANLAFVLMLQGDLRGARDQYQQALQLNPNSQLATKGLRDLQELESRMKVTPASGTQPAVFIPNSLPPADGQP